MSREGQGGRGGEVGRGGTGILFVLSGPSGVGKDAAITALKKQGYPLYYAVTVTTRASRPGEVDGVNYHFISEERFRWMEEHGELLEWAVVHGNIYGTPLAPVREALRRGEDVLLKLDVQGAASVRARVPEAVLIFLAPPTVNDLVERLRQRGTESNAELERRLRDAQAEVESLSLFDYVVVNYEGRLGEAVEKIKAIVDAERRRLRPHRAVL